MARLELGEKWEELMPVIKLISPWMAIMFLASSLSYIFIRLGKQKQIFFFDLFHLILIFATIFTANYLKNKNLYESLSAYGVSFHRHNSEIAQFLNKISKSKINFTFTPHLSPMFRGILSTIYVDLNKETTINKLHNELVKFYKNSTFVKVISVNSMLSTNNVINTNNCEISVCKSKEKNKVIIICVIDNLIKGGAGQAVQNLNLLYNFKFNEGFK